MAVTQNTYTGNGATVLYSFTFPYLETTDVKVTINGTSTTAYTFANATTIQFNTAPANGAAIRIYRDTDDASLAATFYSGSAIRAQDLNDNFTQNLYVTQEVNNNSVNIDGSNPMVGNLNMGGYKIINLQSSPTVDTDAANKHYVDTKVGASGPPGYTNWSYTAGGGETVVGTSGPVLEYQVGKEQVYLNGALQQRNVDYTADNGNTITFTVALTAADNVQVRCVNYLAANPSASYSFTRWRKTYNTLPSPATLIAGNSDAPEVALNYTINREQVFINGALLQRGVDYTTPNVTSITLLSGPLIVGDVVEVHSNNSI
jgi:hypothetical protein